MNKGKATPGPWQADDPNPPQEALRGQPMMVRARGCTIAEVIPQPNAAANAALIAAAPALAEALAYFVTMFGETPDGEWAQQIMEDPSTMTGALDRARAAILLAGGSTP